MSNTPKLLYNKGFSGLGQTGIYILMTGAGLIAGSVAALGIWLVLTGRGIADMPTDMVNPEFANPIKLVQGISTLFSSSYPCLALPISVLRMAGLRWASMEK